MKTNSVAMEALYDALADTLRDLVDNGKAVMDKDTGEIVRITPDAATLNTVRQFLKDAGINPHPGTHPVVNNIAGSLPFDGSEYSDTSAH